MVARKRSTGRPNGLARMPRATSTISATTADAVASYEFGSSGGPFNGTTVALSVINLTNRAPPYVSASNVYGITYDGANANALGRFISLRLQKRW